MIYQKFLEQTLQEASKIASQMFGKVSGKIKEHDAKQVLTDADLAVGKFVIEQIQKTYPAHNIIDEETGVIGKNSEFSWVIDPIDGTVNFAHGVPLYGVMIGLLKNNQPLAGGVALPAFGEICVAEKGKGAFCNSKRLDLTIGEKDTSKIIAFKLAGEPGNLAFNQEQARFEAAVATEFIHLHSSGSVWDTIQLAKGKYGGELNFTSKIWDNIAQQIIIEEAGGIYTDFYGKPMDYSKALTEPDLNYTYCAAPPEIHKKLQEIIHGVDSGFPLSRE